jgi:hypothetical protein
MAEADVYTVPVPSDSQLAMAHRQLGEALAKLDQLSLFHAGAYVSMAIEILEMGGGDFLEGGAESESCLIERLLG